MSSHTLKQQIAKHAKITDIGKSILKRVAEEFSKLDAPAPAVCMLVDNDSKVFIKLMGVRVVVGIYAFLEKNGVLVTYKANSWSDNWENYTVPIDNSILFDEQGNIWISRVSLMNPEQYGYEVLNHAFSAGKESNFKPKI